MANGRCSSTPTLADGTLSAQVNNFSFFRAVTVTYKVPMAQALTDGRHIDAGLR